MKLTFRQIATWWFSQSTSLSHDSKAKGLVSLTSFLPLLQDPKPGLLLAPTLYVLSVSCVPLNTLVFTVEEKISSRYNSYFKEFAPRLRRGESQAKKVTL